MPPGHCNNKTARRGRTLVPLLLLAATLCSDPTRAADSVDLGNNFVTFRVTSPGGNFTASIPGDSVATFVWSDGQQPSQWLTTAQGTGFKYTVTPLAVTTQGQPTATIAVDPSRQHQTLDGFGAALTDSAAELISRSPQRDQILQQLFGSDGAALTFVRVPMGASDLMYNETNLYTYEDTPGSFSIAKANTTIDILKRTKAIVGDSLKILGTPWSAPGWMKRGGKLLPSSCGADLNQVAPKHFDEYAAYFNNFVKAMDAQGLRPWMVSMQNEPLNCKTQMPTTSLTSDDEATLSRKLRAVLPSGVKILGWDHNWSGTDYVNNLLDGGVVDAIGYHCYDGTNYKDQTQRVPTYMSECSGFTGQSETQTAGNLGWEVANLLIGPLRFGSRGSIYWSMAQHPDGSPSLAGSDNCKTCRGMVAITEGGGGSFRANQDLYFWTHFSRFMRPGAVRVDSTQSGTLSTLAARQGSQNVLVVLNSQTTANGGTQGSDPSDFRRHIVQWDGDTSATRTSWLVGADRQRRWVPNAATLTCLTTAGIAGPNVVSSNVLARYLDIQNVWAVCGAASMGSRSELELGTFLQSSGGARLTLTSGGQLTARDSTGNARRAPPGTGDRFILDEDQSLRLYSGRNVVWSSNTTNSGAVRLNMRDDGTFVLADGNGRVVFNSASLA